MLCMHGAHLNDGAIEPNIAGIEPSYIARQLYSFKNGDRHGSNSASHAGSS